MDLTSYFNSSKAPKKVVKELNQNTNEHAVMKILCQEQNINAKSLDNNEKTKFTKYGKERILGIKLIMNANRDKYGPLIKDFNREYLSGNNKYPKTLQDTYNLLRGWNKHQPTGQKYPIKGWIILQHHGERRIDCGNVGQ